MSLSRLLLVARRIGRSLWFRPALFAALAIGALALAPVFEPFAPAALSERLARDDLDRVLGVLASSMLAVAVFSLGAMVSALQAAAAAATPRARPLLTADETAQIAISTFIGAFVFGVLGLVGLSLDLYGPAGRVVMIGLSVLLLAVVIVVLIAWIRVLAGMGGVREAVRLVEAETASAVSRNLADRRLGAPDGAGPPGGAQAVFPDRFGWVQMIDGAALASAAEELDAELFVAVSPGASVHPTRPLLHVSHGLDEAAAARLRAAFVVEPERAFHHDPRYGLIVLSEIASRALSPAVNDPGTAIDVIGALTRALAGWATAEAEAAAARAPEDAPDAPSRLHLPALAGDDLMDDAFRAIARDGAALVEVMAALQKGLGALAAAFPERLGPAARRAAAEAAARAAAAMAHPPDLDAVEAARREAGLA